MRRLVSALNLTALLALAALCDLVFYRVVSGVFLPSQQGNASERWMAGLAIFLSNFSGLLALLLAVVALVTALRSDAVFPRSMRITVSTIGLFFSILAALDVLALLAPRYHVHLRISHGFLAFFLALGAWQGTRPTRAKVAVTLFAVPVLLQSAALFVHRVGSVSRLDAGEMLRMSNAIALAAMMAAPALLMPGLGKLRFTIATGTGTLVALALGAASVLRFDLVQAVAYYGFRLDLTGMASTNERAFTAALVLGIAGICTTVVGCVLKRGAAGLKGWAVLLVATAGMDIHSAKLALFNLCGLLALASASVEEAPAPATNLVPEE